MTNKNVTELIASMMGTELIISSSSSPSGFKADFNKLVEIKSGGILESFHGNGATVNKACADLLRQISRKTLVINAYSPDRCEYRIPILDIN